MKKNSRLPDLKDRVGQLFMIGIKGESLSTEEKEFICSNNIGFIILFSRNFRSSDQLIILTSEIHDLCDTPPAIFIDQEGGPIVRLGEDGSTMISHMGLAATGKKRNARRSGSIIGKEMRALGIDGVFAPVLDVNSHKENPVIGIRSFSDDPDVVAEYGSEFFQGLKKEKILGCGKHFPGHGHTVKDSHLEIPESVIDKRFLSEINLPPFQKLINKGINSLMTAHVHFPLISNNIATFSPVITGDILRNKLEFNGVLFSDCLEMDAIKNNFGSQDIIDGIIQSVVDVAIVSHSLTLQKELIGLMRSNIDTGEIPEGRIEDSLRRIRELKKNMKRRSIGRQKKSLRLRKKIRVERKIAGESITLLKNDHGLIPLNKSRSILMIDLKQSIHSANLHNRKGLNILESIAGHFFPFVEYFIPEQEFGITEDEKKKIINTDHIMIFDYSWSGVLNKAQKSFMENIFNLRKDMIIICANSPYVADDYDSAGTIILTYGSRNVQIEALFSILSGGLKPKGKLPVKISGKFPSGSGV